VAAFHHVDVVHTYLAWPQKMNFEEADRRRTPSLYSDASGVGAALPLALLVKWLQLPVMVQLLCLRCRPPHRSQSSTRRHRSTASLLLKLRASCPLHGRRTRGPGCLGFTTMEYLEAVGRALWRREGKGDRSVVAAVLTRVYLEVELHRYGLFRCKSN
jgi:hypothetical protein